MHGEYPVTIRKCEDCKAPVTDLKYAKFCPPCRAAKRAKPKKYVFTERMDYAIKDAYAQRADRRMSPIPNLKELAAKWKMPDWAVKKRGMELGVGRIKELPWSDRELALLNRFSWMSVPRIRLKFKAAGFRRTENAIKIKLTRTGARIANTDYYSATGLSRCFGTDAHTVTRWIRRGMLQAEMKGTERHAGNGGDIYMIHESSIYAFVTKHPMEFDIRKVDQLWFMDIVTQGKVGESVSRIL